MVAVLYIVTVAKYGFIHSVNSILYLFSVWKIIST